jgi:pimeloyl-ACP methyl ester carboxylesterase
MLRQGSDKDRTRIGQGSDKEETPVTLGSDLHLILRGQGSRVLFVHGSFGDALEDWAPQSALATRFELLLLDRRGYGESPTRLAPVPTDAMIFAEQAAEIAELLGTGAHLVGQSYGAVLCLLAALRRPEAVRSLTVIEPPAYALVRGHPDVESLIARLAPVYASVFTLTPEVFRAQAFAAMGFIAGSHPLSARERKNAEATMAEPPAWMATVPLEPLASAPFRTLVVTGNWGGASTSARDVAGRACTAVCVALVETIGAEYALIEGAGHAAQFTGKPFNERLAAFLSRAESDEESGKSPRSG